MKSVCIAHGGDVSDPSGGTNRISAFATGLADRGHDVTLVVPEPAADPQYDLGDVTLRPISVPSAVRTAPTRGLAVARRAKQVAAEQGSTLQYEHSLLAGLGTLAGASAYVLDMHDLAHARYDHVDSVAAPLLGRGVAWLERRAVARADHVVTVSEYMARTLREEWGVDEDRVSVIPNGFFPDTLAPGTDTEVVEGRVCFLGTLHPKVDVDAVEGVCRLSDVEDVVVIGDGAQRDRLEALEAEYEALEVTGRLPDEEAFRLLASAAVAINPQHASDLQHSSSPVKLYYYAAMGKPMVVTEGPPVVEELSRADAAIATDDRTAFVDAVQRVLGDESLARGLSENARTVADRFEWSNRVEELVTVHE